MDYVLNKRYDTTFTMNWIGTESSTSERDVKIFESTVTKGIKEITDFNDTVQFENDSHYFAKYFDYSNGRESGTTWSNKIDISGITMNFCPENNFFIRIYYYRIDITKTIPAKELKISNIIINGIYDIGETDEAFTITGNTFIILKPKDIYKVFSITDFEVFGVNIEVLTLQYRWTQNGGRTYTPWEPLTTENISTCKLNETRFAQIEYLVQSNVSNISRVYDVILIGDFQNISANYLKSNRYGLKEDCATRFINGADSPGDDDNSSDVCLSGITNIWGCGSDITGNYTNYNRDYYTQYLSCYMLKDVYGNLEAENNKPTNQAGLWKPYETEKITGFYNMLANQTNQMLGWDIEYYRTDPDEKGVDMYLHEYQLFNMTDVQKIKVIVPDNTFPDNQVQINEFSLDLFDTFEINILKDEFKKAFGIEKRPAQKDVLYFCQTNRLYRVKHSQVFRDIMQQGIYYKVILEKYEQLANEQIINQRAKALIEPLTDNTTIDELFGFENRQDEEKIANKKQMKPLTHDAFRINVNPIAVINKKKIFNKGINIADSYYDFTNAKTTVSAVTYTVSDKVLNVSDNRSIMCWLNFNNLFDENNIITDNVFESYNIPKNTYYEFLNNYNETLELGYKIWYANSEFGLTINKNNFTLPTKELTTNLWYGFLVNFDNRQNSTDLNLYKRNCDYYIKYFTNGYKSVTLESNNTTDIDYYTSIGYKPVKNVDIIKNISDPKLKLLYTKTYSNISNESFSHNTDLVVNTSNIKLTNIRILDDVIPDESKSNLLNQNIIKDSNHLILADNANIQMYARNVPNKLWE
jgi:hypothetical protein